MQTDVFIGVDVVETEGDEFTRGVVQLRRELHARGTGTHDGDIELIGAQRFGLRVSAQEGIDQTTMKAIRLLRALERDGVFRNARCAEVVDAAADSENKDVVVDATSRHDLLAILVMHRPDEHLPCRAIKPDHLAKAIAEAMPVRLREIVEFVYVEIDGARCELVQVRFPEVGSTALDQRDFRATLATQGIAKTRDELEAAGAATDDDDLG